MYFWSSLAQLQQPTIFGYSKLIFDCSTSAMSLEYSRAGRIEEIASTVGSATTYLEATAAEIRMIKINWQSYVQGEIITNEQYSLITRLENAGSSEARGRVIHENPRLTAKVFTHILNRISKEQTLQYILTLLDDILQEDKQRVNMFREYFDSVREPLWSHFFNFFQRGDPFCMYQASRIVAKFACWSMQPMEENELMYYLNWLCEQLKIKKNNYDQTVARNLQMIVRIREYRRRLVSVGGVEAIVEVLACKQAISHQLHYQLIFCLWCLSFDAASVEYMWRSVPSLLATVTDIMREADREKITRITLALCRSILEKLSESSQERYCCLSLVQFQVLRYLELLSQKDFSHDPELTDDMKFLTEKLLTSLQDVSSLEEYLIELTSGRLEWSPVHKSEKFWTENVVRFTERNCEILKMLIAVVELDGEAQGLAVAVHDIGEFARYYPRGRQLIGDLGAKHLVMGLLQHEDATVRYNALVALQKIMVHNWEYLGKQLDTVADQPAALGKPGELRAS